MHGKKVSINLCTQWLWPDWVCELRGGVARVRTVPRGCPCRPWSCSGDDKTCGARVVPLLRYMRTAGALEPRGALNNFVNKMLHCECVMVSDAVGDQGDGDADLLLGKTDWWD